MLEKTYDPKQVESTWYDRWEKAGSFKPQGMDNPYCIMIPPPNVTGSLHMGHAFQQTLMDILIRYHRMSGDQTLWQVGTDHAGIATQMMVERQLNAEGSSKHDLGREGFVNRVWQWKAEYGNNITQQLRRMGASVDWSRERFTLDEGLSKAVQAVFIQLYDEGLIYRGKRLVNWDPVLLTAVSDLEVESEEEQSYLWHIRYPLLDSNAFVTVATTRPETLLGDVAVAVHPEDERYQHLIGKKIKLPLCDRLIPIIADESVAKEFGSGCVKITPAHDFNDYALGQRHGLPQINIFTLDAKLNENVPKEYQGLDRYAAREKIVKDLSEFGLIEKIEKHTSMIPRGDRSGAVLEPLLTDQWFVKVESLAKPAIAAVEEGKIRFIPENWSKTYFEWMRNIQDWCISRQLWWGHRIPAWYDNQGNIYVAATEANVRQKYKLDPALPLHQDEDVLDTWFSSALWPFSTLGWPEKTQDFKTFYPTQVLITGFDIIFFWVARMIMFGLKFTHQIPFKDVYINAIIQDQNGQKMSKTKGNVLDPIDLIDGIDLESLVQKRTTGLIHPNDAKEIAEATRAQFPKGISAHGVDALRFTFAALATPSRYIRFEMGRVEGNRHFCNKLWNAARYVLLNTEEKDLGTNESDRTLNLPDHWILSRWQQAKIAIATHLNDYRFDLAAQTIYEFTWNEYCDWYLEFSKPILNASASSDDFVPVSNLGLKQQQRGTRYTLVMVLEEMLKVMHPFMPYITEEIWQRVAPLLNIKLDMKFESIMLQSYPVGEESLINPNAETDIEWLKTFILGIRNIRGEMNISPGKILPVLLYNASDSDRKIVERNEALLKSLAKIETITWLNVDAPRPASATALVGMMEILVPIAGLIDVQAEVQRLQKEIDKLSKDFERTNVKLNNPNFVEKAPAELVAEEKKRQIELTIVIAKLEGQKREMKEVSELNASASPSLLAPSPSLPRKTGEGA